MTWFIRIVLSSNQLARRWRGLTASSPPPETLPKNDEIRWREQIARNLSAAHSIGGITDLTLEPVESQFSVIISCYNTIWTLLLSLRHR